MTQSLEQKVSAALTNDAITPAEVEALANELDVGIAEAERLASKLHEDVHDPQLYPDRREAKVQLDDAEFAVGRLLTLRPRLERRLAAVETAEEFARADAEYQRLKVKRDAAAAAFAKYPDLVAQSVEILHTARAFDAECDRFNSAAPGGEHRRLLGVELVARGLSAFSIYQPEISAAVHLPEFDNSELTAWPPQPNVAALVGPVAFDQRYSADWGLLKEREAQAARDKNQREEKEREAAAVEAQRRSGAPVWWQGKRAY
jgi:hypothetical protein